MALLAVTFCYCVGMCVGQMLGEQTFLLSLFLFLFLGMRKDCDLAVFVDVPKALAGMFICLIAHS